VNLLRIALISLLAQAGASAQQGAHVDGTVVKLGSGEPLAGANVQLHLEKVTAARPEADTPELQMPSTTTAADGKFTIDRVPPGVYRLYATRSGGYVPAEYGERSPTGEGIPIELTAGQKMSGVQLALAPTGSISGRIYDKDGEPLGGALVQATRTFYRNGRKTLTIVQSVVSDDRGEYRLFWLPAGRYYVSVRADATELPADLAVPNGVSVALVHITEPARFGTYEQASDPIVHKRVLSTGEIVEEIAVPVFFPGVMDASGASPITVGAGANTGGVDVNAGVGLVRTRHIRGRVINPQNGQPETKAGVTAVPQASDPLPSIPAARTDANGVFDIAGVRPGSYFVVATSGRMGAIAAVTVGDADVQNLAIIDSGDLKLSGRFILEGSSNPGEDGPRIGQLTRDPEIFGMPPGGPGFSPPPQPDGAFTLDGVPAGRFRVEVHLPADAYVKSMRMGDIDVLEDGLQLDRQPENPLEIVIGANAGRIEGSVVNSRQEALPNRTVALIPDAPHRRRADLYKNVATDAAGRYQIHDIPPGDYELFAWENIEPGAWQDPEYLQAFQGRGRTVHISEGSHETQQLTVIP
jgi:hypothetical protein